MAPQVMIRGHADILIAGCERVFAKISNREYSLNPDDHEGPFTTFDSDLGRNLGLPEEARARDVVKALFLTEGDLIAQAIKVARWSGFQEDNAQEVFEGE